MHTLRPRFLSVVLSCFCASYSAFIQAQEPAATVSPAVTRANPLPANEGTRVIEDDNTRIEETRHKGQVVRVRVTSKPGGGPSYEIQLRPGRGPASAGREESGRSAWQILSF